MATSANAIVQTKTIVKKITVGKPLSAGLASSGELKNLDDVNKTALSGINRMLLWDSATQKFKFHPHTIRFHDDIDVSRLSSRNNVLLWDSNQVQFEAFDLINAVKEKFKEEIFDPSINGEFVWDSGTGQGTAHTLFLATQSLLTDGTYGSSTQIPQFIVNEKGIIMSAQNVDVASLSSITFDSATATLNITTTDSGQFSARIGLNNFSTSDLAEGSNLYYTTSRADSAFDDRLAIKTTADLAEGLSTNFYYTQTRFDSALELKTTNDLTEGTDNLYYTVARADSDARSAISLTTSNPSGIGLLTYDSSRGRFHFKDSDIARTDIKTVFNQGIFLPEGASINLDSSTTIFKDDADDILKISNSSASEGGSIELTAREHFSIKLINGSTTILEQTKAGIFVTGGVTADSATLPILTGNVLFKGELHGPGTMVIDPAGIGDNTGKVVIRGDLQVDGTETIVNSTTLSVNDKNIVLADSAVDSNAADGAGITVTGANATILYNASTDTWNLNKPLGNNVNHLTNFTTTNLTEGSNLYYTHTRADSAARNAISITVNTGAAPNLDSSSVSLTRDSAGVGYLLDLQDLQEGSKHTSVTYTQFNGDGTKLIMPEYPAGGGASTNFDAVFTYDLSSAYDIRSALLDSSPSEYTNNTVLFKKVALTFNHDGSRVMTFSPSGDPAFNQYDLNTNYDISSVASSTPSGTLANDPFFVQWSDVVFKPDGTKMYVIQSSTSGIVKQFNLSTAGDISTASAASASSHQFSLNTEQGNGSTLGLAINSTGTKIYTGFNPSGGLNPRIYQYDLSTPYDLSTVSYNNSVHTFPDAAKIGRIDYMNLVNDTDLYVTGLHQPGGGINGYMAVYKVSLPSGTTGDGNLEYDASTGEITFTGPSASEVRAHFAAGTNIAYDSNTGTFSLPDGPVTAGTYGTASLIPVLTVDARGLIDSIGTVSVAGVSSTSFDSDSGVLTINTADGNSFPTIILDSDLSNKRARKAISVGDAGGDGSLTYNETTGIITYTGPSASEVRSHFSASGDLSYDSSTGVFSFDVEDVYTKSNFDSDWNQALDEAAINGTGLSFDSASNTLSITNTGVTAGTYGSAVLVPVLKVNAQGQVDSAGTVQVAGVSSVSFDSAAGIFTINTADGNSFPTTILDSDLTKTRTRDVLSAIDLGGDGSFAYDSSRGRFTYTGPSATEVRAHFTGTDGINYSNSTGVIKTEPTFDIVYNNATFNNITNVTGETIHTPDHTTATSDSQIIIDTTAHNSNFMSIEFTVHADDSASNHSQITKALVTYNKTSAFYSEYGVISSFTGDSDIGTLVADADGTNIRLKFTRASGMGNVNLRTIKNVLK